ncbi:MAG TPA: hypothetical protein PKZ07_14745 [Sedimentisphaerales bacterium]|nr:hypothetical protein [Sedimentisphaerales bacterium]
MASFDRFKLVWDERVRRTKITSVLAVFMVIAAFVISMTILLGYSKISGDRESVILQPWFMALSMVIGTFFKASDSNPAPAPESPDLDTDEVMEIINRAKTEGQTVTVEDIIKVLKIKPNRDQMEQIRRMVKP